MGTFASFSHENYRLRETVARNARPPPPVGSSQANFQSRSGLKPQGNEEETSFVRSADRISAISSLHNQWADPVKIRLPSVLLCGLLPPVKSYIRFAISGLT